MTTRNNFFFPNIKRQTNSISEEFQGSERQNEKTAIPAVFFSFGCRMIKGC